MHSAESKSKTLPVTGCSYRNIQEKSFMNDHISAESEFSNFMIEYLGKIGTEVKNTLACLSGVWMGSNHEKIEVENIATHSLYTKFLNMYSTSIPDRCTVLLDYFPCLFM